MKKFLVLFALMLGLAANSYGQGAVIYANFDGASFYAPIYNTDGTTLLDGTGFTAQLFYGSTGTADNALTALSGTAVNFTTGSGIFDFTDSVQIPGFAAGSTVKLQVRAWNNANGTITSFDSATIRGSSTSFTSPLVDVTDTLHLSYMTGLQSFQLAAVPEPTTIALGVLGGLGLLARRRRNA